MFIDAVEIDWRAVESDSYVRDIPALAAVRRVELERPVTFLVGENGSGKSTLLEAIAVAWGMNPEGGSRNYSFSTRDTHSSLHEAVHLLRGMARPRHSFFLRAESFYNVATAAEEYFGGGGWEAYGGRPLHQQSHGESFLATVQGNFRAGGLYFLDEPEAALSPSRQLTLLYEIDRLAAEGAQFVIASHSPILLGLPGAAILSFGNDGLSEIAYEDTEGYLVTEMFINRREQVLAHLLEDAEASE